MLSAVLAAVLTVSEATPPGDAPFLGAEADAGVTPPDFVKGELSMYLGSDRLTVKNTRVGVSAGVDRFGQAFYLLVEPMVDLRFFDGKLGIGVGAPLRIELFDFETDTSTGAPVGAAHLGTLRTKDWDSVHDFGRILKYVTFGKKEDQLFISAGQRYASSIGHGALVRRYAPNIDIDYPRASAQIDWYNEYGGFELMTNDLLEWNQLAGIAFLKPFSFFHPESVVLKTLSLGVSGGLDWKAPWALSTDPATGVRRLDSDQRLVATTRAATLVGFDVELKVLKTEAVDLKPYIDYSMLVGGDGGLTVGLLGRFNVGTSVVNAFRVVLEGRALGSRYQPSYFDTFYEIDRFVLRDVRASGASVAELVPKQRYLLEHGLGTRFGYYAEASWGIPGAVGLTLAIEGVSNAAPMSFVAHLEVPVLSFLQVFGSYYLRGVERFSELTQVSDGTLGLFGSKAIAFAGARLRVLPFLFINGRLYKTFRMNPELQRYDNQFGFVVDLELGYEFQPKAPPPEA
jgi:hypothetical protein